MRVYWTLFEDRTGKEKANKWNIQSWFLGTVSISVILPERKAYKQYLILELLIMMIYKNYNLRLGELKVQLKYLLWGVSMYLLIVLILSSSNYLNHCYSEDCAVML